MEHFRWQLTTSESGRTVAPSQDGVFMKALDSIWEIPVLSLSVDSSPYETPEGFQFIVRCKLESEGDKESFSRAEGLNNAPRQ